MRKIKSLMLVTMLVTPLVFAGDYHNHSTITYEKKSLANAADGQQCDYGTSDSQWFIGSVPTNGEYAIGGCIRPRGTTILWTGGIVTDNDENTEDEAYFGMNGKF